MRTLAFPVVVRHPDSQEAISYVAGDTPPEWAAEQITNPAAWALDDDAGEPESEDRTVSTRRRKDDLLAIADAADVTVDEHATKPQIVQALLDAGITEG